MFVFVFFYTYLKILLTWTIHLYLWSCTTKGYSLQVKRRGCHVCKKNLKTFSMNFKILILKYACTNVLTFWFITYKRCMFVHHDVQVFLCTCVYLVPLQHSSTFIYMYWAPFSLKQLILFPRRWSCHWVDFILSKLLRYI